MTGRWRVTVDGSCIGSGVCLATAPAHFRAVRHRSAPVSPDAEPDEALAAAEELCPVAAIRLDRTGGRRAGPGGDPDGPPPATRTR